MKKIWSRLEGELTSKASEISLLLLCVHNRGDSQKWLCGAGVWKVEWDEQARGGHGGVHLCARPPTP